MSVNFDGKLPLCYSKFAAVKCIDLWLLLCYRSSVGVSGSQQTMFYAPVTDSMKVGQGGGNPHEGEFIEVTEMKVDQCLEKMLNNSTIERSLGLVFALLWFQHYKT